jgi:hypothetical protein
MGTVDKALNKVLSQPPLVTCHLNTGNHRHYVMILTADSVNPETKSSLVWVKFIGELIGGSESFIWARPDRASVAVALPTTLLHDGLEKP